MKLGFALVSTFGLIFVLTMAGLHTALAVRDPAKGKQIFVKCQACHSIEKGVNKVGPSLHAIVGTKAGDVPGYNFTDAMKNSGLTWDEATLDKYLTSPRKMVPGTRMVF